MSGIHDAIMERLEQRLTDDLINNIPANDPARAGVVRKGPLQGNPDPDAARISITIHENDPDDMDEWQDELVEVEVGGVVTYARRFTVKARCLLERTREDLEAARDIASTLMERLEQAILAETFTGVTSGSERVSRPAVATTMRSRMTQGGGPPDAYDFHIKVQFDVLTTKTGVFS